MPAKAKLSGSEALRPGAGPAILVLDQDPGLRRLLRRELTAVGYRVRDVEPGEGVLESVVEDGCDLLILDIDASMECGAKAIRVVREVSDVPILALSIRREEDFIADALDSGADDYVLKPFGTKELLARVNSALRRRAREQGNLTRVVSGALEIDLLRHRVRLEGRDVHLSPKSYQVLSVLTANAGKVVPHEEILAAVWGPRLVDRNCLRMAIREIRHRLELDPDHPIRILTEPWVGYRLEVEQFDPSAGTEDLRTLHRRRPRPGSIEGVG